jgi:hypothetical protein
MIENEMSGACSTHRNLMGRPRHRWEDDFKADTTEIVSMWLRM